MPNFVRTLVPVGMALAATFMAAPAVVDSPYVVAEQPTASDSIFLVKEKTGEQ